MKENTPSFVREFGRAINNNIPSFPKKKIAQRKSGQCLTADNSLNILKDEKEQKLFKL